MNGTKIFHSEVSYLIRAGIKLIAAEAYWHQMTKKFGAYSPISDMAYDEIEWREAITYESLDSFTLSQRAKDLYYQIMTIHINHN